MTTMTHFNPLSSGVRPRFPLGEVVMTENAMRMLRDDEVGMALANHTHGDWGDVCPEDRAENERALAEGGRLFSVYHDGSGVKFWIITEADRRATTVLLPDDY
jgi:hypothetical protein